MGSAKTQKGLRKGGHIRGSRVGSKAKKKKTTHCLKVEKAGPWNHGHAVLLLQRRWDRVLQHGCD